MIEGVIRGRICQSVHRYAKANNKYRKYFHKSNVPSYLTNLEANNLYRKAMFQNLPVIGFRWVHDVSRFNKEFIKKYNKNTEIRFFLEVGVEYPKKLFSSHKELMFLLGRKRFEKVEKLVCSIEDKKKYVIRIRALKQALNHGLILIEINRVIRFNQEVWLKSYINITRD